MDAKQGWQEAVPAMLAGKQRPRALKLLASPKSWGWKRDFCTGSVRSPDPDPDACHTSSEVPPGSSRAQHEQAKQAAAGG